MRPLDEELERADCRALVIVAESSRDPYLAPFVGSARLGAAFFIAPLGRAARLAYLSPLDREEAAASGLHLLDPQALDVERWARDGASPGEQMANCLSRALQLCEVAPGQIALAGCESAGKVTVAARQLVDEGWSFVAGESIVLARRKCKTDQELRAIRAAARGAEVALQRVAACLTAATERDGELWSGGERLRVGHLRAAIGMVLAEHGLEQPNGNIVAPGATGGVPHSCGEDHQVLQPRQSLVVDVFPRGRMFADCTRTFCVGRPSADLARAHQHVVAALDLARGQVRPGARGWDIQEKVCAYFSEAGYATPISHPGTTRGYVHGLGHGVGYEVHEYPIFKREAGEEGYLQAGDVITLEPGLYDPEAGFGLRLEDLYAVTGDGLENLTPLPYELDPGAW